jgi:hypothetical protein
MPLCVSAASSSSLDESNRGRLVGLVETGNSSFACFVGLTVVWAFVGVSCAGLEDSLPMFAVGEALVADDDFEAGEKLIFDCRLRSRAFLGGMVAVVAESRLHRLSLTFGCFSKAVRVAVTLTLRAQQVCETQNISRRTTATIDA